MHEEEDDDDDDVTFGIDSALILSPNTQHNLLFFSELVFKYFVIQIRQFNFTINQANMHNIRNKQTHKQPFFY